SWGFLFLHCKATTKRNRNLVSRFEGSVSSGFQETGGARFLGDENGGLGLLRIFLTRFCDIGIALVPDLSDRKPPAVLDRHTRSVKHEISATAITGASGNCNMCPTTTMAAAA